ncbi:MAG TPA: asparagine synthase (glutamine-hydrolyzing) [Phycisphaerales bacterium]|nr:asparagine synthase (glutamine-hydrolyzing) [Phycisphaerales bacterium]HMP37929.1 asparagine synthase (glutamine-hydrolyzing) [Phycisphaerales bacterium]
MCGICGIVDFAGRLGPGEPARLVAAMRDAMRHRGPDDLGIATLDRGRVALGHRRLAIVDLSADGRQPMADESESVHVVFNGEIYGHAALRVELEREGHRFRTRTDTEVIPHLLEGADASNLAERLGRLDGMFALAAWQSAERRLLLARDPFGKKPLYWMEGDGFVAFASELRPMAVLPGAARSLCPEAIAEYLLLQYVPAPRSIWTDVRKLEPGTCLALDFADGRPRGTPRRHWSFEPRPPRRDEAWRTLDEGADRLLPILRRAVEKRLMGDVPLGAFLSGGVDSGLVIAIMRRELGIPVETFSIGFEGDAASEHELAREAARHLGCNHRDEVLRPDAIELVSTIAERLDEPNGDSSCLPTYLLCAHARRFVTVALSGDGGDELFGGYNRYAETIAECARGWSGAARRALLRLRGVAVANPSDRYLSPRWLIWRPEDVVELVGAPTGDLAARLARWAQRLDDSGRPLIDRMRGLDVESYLPGAVLAKVDRMSMLHALEVRCPLLDREVAAFAARIPEAMLVGRGDDGVLTTKRLLRHLAGRYFPREWMARRKMGFGLPATTFAPERLLAMARERLLGSDARVGEFLDRGALRRQVEHMANPGCFSVYRLWPLLVLELWLRSLPGRSSVARVPGSAAAMTTAR